MERNKRLTTRTTFLAPYKLTPSGRNVLNINALSHNTPQAGVYFIKENKSNTIVYVGYSVSNLYKTITRHFQSWTDIQRAIKTRFTYPKYGYSVKIIFTTPKEAALLEKYFILKLQPRDNTIKYENYLFPDELHQAEKIVNNDYIFLSNTTEDTPF
jgi:excinuclease UvrABC nuclease subunit